MAEHRNSLPPGYRLHWYVIRQILGQGGFGITYLADDTNLTQAVAIKEYLPVDMAVRDHDASVQPVSGEHGDQFRWGLDRFMSEARTLARFKHPNIVRVFTVFPENNTAYMVMEYESGRGLHEILKDRKTISEAELKAIVLPILDGLNEIHKQGFVHRDIKPANIFIRENGSPVLLDFGSARQSFSEHTRTLTAMVSPGFAPFEQYSGKGEKQGPWTDIYGLGATLYRAAVGRAPADAIDRSEALLHGSRDVYVPIAEIQPPGYSAAFLAAIDMALAFHPADRPRSAAAWRDALTGAPTEAATVFAPPAPAIVTGVKPSSIGAAAPGPGHAPAAVSKTKRRSSRRFWTVVIILWVLFIWPGLLRHHSSEPPPAAAGKTSEIPAPAGEVAATDQERHATGPVGITPSAPGTQPAGKNSAGKVGLTQAPGSTAESGGETTPASATVPTPAGLVTASDRNLLESLRQNLLQHPDTPESRQQLRMVVGHFDRIIREALGQHDYDRAEAYAQALLKLAPDNQRLRAVARRIESAKGQ